MVSLDRLSRIPHPAGVWLMTLLLALAIAGLAFVYALLTLYVSRILQMPDQAVYSLNGTFNAVLFACSLLGGYLGGSYFGYRFSIGLGFLLGTLALLILMFQSFIALYWGLAFLSLSSGLFLPCAFVVIGRLYRREDPRRYIGFTLAYVGINLGAFSAETVAGYVSDNLGYNYAFLFGAVCFFLALIIFIRFQGLYNDKHGLYGYDKERPDAIRRSRLTGFFILIIALPVLAALLHWYEFSYYFVILLTIVAFIGLLYIARYEGVLYRHRIYVFLILLIFSLAFLTLYNLIPGVLTLFIARNVNHYFFNFFRMHTASFDSLNPLFIFVVGGALVLGWRQLWRRNFVFSVPFKFALGSISMGLGYLVITLGIHFQDLVGLVNPWWVVLSYLLQTIGELMIVPIGFAVVGQLSPMRLEGVLMGIWQLTVGMAASISVIFSRFVILPSHQIDPTMTNPLYSRVFAGYGAIAVFVGCVLFFLMPYIRRVLSEAMKR